MNVTVLMPVYNGGNYLNEALKSVLGQTYPDFELVIINDGSTDDTEAIIIGFNDARIRYIKHKHNAGLIASLNEGLAIAKGRYIIRMDADDISLPDRFEKQVAFMEANPYVDICGTAFSVIDAAEVIRHPATNDECKVKLLQNTVVGHPTVIMRRESFLKHNLKFDTDALHAEDYRLWAEASIKGLKISNLPEILLRYRNHAAQVSAIKAAEQLKTVTQVRLWYAQQYFAGLLKDKLSVYTDLVGRSINSFAAFVNARQLVKQLKNENRLRNYFDIAIFEAFFDDLLKIANFRIYVMCVDCNASIMMRSVFDGYFYTNTSMYQKAKFILRSIQSLF